MKKAVAHIRDIYARLGQETVRYLIAGVLTTLIDLGIFSILIAFGTDDRLANRVSIVTAVLFAYFINKLFVFRRHSASKSALVLEFLKFICGRAVTALLEDWGYPLLLGVVGEREVLAKAFTIVVVFILNYLISKLFVFRSGSSPEN